MSASAVPEMCMSGKKIDDFGKSALQITLKVKTSNALSIFIWLDHRIYSTFTYDEGEEDQLGVVVKKLFQVKFPHLSATNLLSYDKIRI